MRHPLVLLLALALLGPGVGLARAAGGAHSEPQPAEGDNLTPAERMASRFPQPVKVGALVGWPLLDYDDVVLGHVREVARTAQGAMFLVCDVGGWFGPGRLVGVPVEAVALIGRHVALLDITPDELAELPTWTGQDATLVAADTTIRLAISRR